MTKRSDRLLREIEAGALDHRTPTGDLLLKVVALGGRSGSTQLRDWAAHELRGYGPEDELPTYRKIAAPLHVDMMNMRWAVKGKAVSPWELPEFAQDKITNDVDLRMGIATIERFARQCPADDVVKLQPPGAQELVMLLNAQGNVNGHLERLYWGVSPVALDGVVDQVRTALVVMVAEMNATIPEGTEIPPAEVATNAVTFAVTGRRNKVNFAAPQSGSTITPAPPPEDEKPQRWLRIAGTVLLGVVAIAGMIFALMQVQGWSFR